MSKSLEPRVLLVEDEPSLALTLADRLTSEGYAVVVEDDGQRGFERALAEPFDVLVLDVMLPGKNGFDVCRDLRQRGIETPILMLTARVQVVDKVVGLKLGADDYLTKPFDHLELLARLEALLRRSRSPVAAGGDSYSFDDLHIDWKSAEVRRAGTLVPLSALEYKLLRHLIENRGAVVSREELLDRVWGYDATAQTRTVDVHMASLRQKIERHPAKPEHLVTVHRLGYKFVD